MSELLSLQHSFRGARLDRGVLWGSIIALTFVGFGMFAAGGPTAFIDLPSALIVIGGTLGATLVAVPAEDIRRSLRQLGSTLLPAQTMLRPRIRRLIELNVRARSDGLLTLQPEVLRESDQFFRKGLELVVDGIPADEIRYILDFEIERVSDEWERSARVFHTMAVLAPAMGLAGTLIGLVDMLRHLENPEQIGPAMAIALLTALYGTLAANLVLLPLANKIRSRAADERSAQELTLEGLLCISRNMNPRITKECLLSFVPAEKRVLNFG